MLSYPASLRALMESPSLPKPLPSSIWNINSKVGLNLFAFFFSGDKHDLHVYLYQIPSFRDINIAEVKQPEGWQNYAWVTWNKIMFKKYIQIFQRKVKIKNNKLTRNLKCIIPKNFSACLLSFQNILRDYPFNNDQTDFLVTSNNFTFKACVNPWINLLDTFPKLAHSGVF